MKNYSIISGTGRAGTTLLVRILAKAGFDTGFDPVDLPVDSIAKAGLEVDVRAKPDCSIVKSPWIATYIDEVLSDENVKIQHAIVCMRNLHDAAESRRRVQKLNNTNGEVPGGLWGVSDPTMQEAYLADIFFNFIFALSKHGVPMTFLHFPRFATDFAYFATKMTEIFPAADAKLLLTAYESEVDVELINSFAHH